MNKYLLSLLSGTALLMLSVSAIASTDIVVADSVGGINTSGLGTSLNMNSVVNDVSGVAQNIASQGVNTVVGTAQNVASQSIDTVIGTAENATSQWTGMVSGITSEVTDVTSNLSGAVSQVQGLMSGNVSGLANQVTGGALSNVSGVLDLVNSPQGLLTMATGGLSWANVSSLAMGATQGALMNFMTIPPVGIPVQDPKLKGDTAAEQAAKTESAELDKRISEEQQKQVDAIGSRPATQASEGTPAQQQVAQNPTEEPSVDTCPALMASYPRQSQKAYEFIEKYVLDDKTPSQYGAPQDTMQAAVQYVEQNFFIKNTDSTDSKESKLTLDEMKKIQEKRHAYQRDVVADLLATGIGVQKFLVEDAKSISMAPTSGCNEIDDLNVGTMILISMAKQTIADIVLQMKLMEFEGVRRVYGVPVGLLENPQKEEQAAQAAQ